MKLRLGIQVGRDVPLKPKTHGGLTRNFALTRQCNDVLLVSYEESDRAVMWLA